MPNPNVPGTIGMFPVEVRTLHGEVAGACCSMPLRLQLLVHSVWSLCDLVHT